jgi:hypothetical protein
MEAVVESGKGFEGETKPDGAVVNAVWGVERRGKKFTETV